jgi:cobalt-zinc-cadmium efflux system outer membrane protein
MTAFRTGVASLGLWRLPLVLAACLGLAGAAWAGPEAAAPDAPPPIMPLDVAVRWALEHNPELAAIRQQHGIAAAGIVIAQTYPFNPGYEGKLRAASGPGSAGITNHFTHEHRFFLDLEVCGQRRFRREGAAATLSRTDWEIAYQEMSLVARVARAYGTLLYRQEKLRLVEETISINERGADDVRKLLAGGKLQRADLLLARSEVANARGQLGLAQVALQTAAADLRRALGLVCEPFALTGTLELPPLPEDCASLTEAALRLRADLRAREAAVAEADARLRLEIANRWGNPSFGPDYEYDPTQISMIGAQITLPLPVLNTHRGDIQQREAERTKAALELRQTEVLVRQDVQAALARLASARTWAETYRSQILPDLREYLKGMEKLLLQNDPGADVLRVIDVRRNLLRARDGYLDALWEVIQARADLAAAVGDLDLAVACKPCPETPAPTSRPQP